MPFIGEESPVALLYAEKLWHLFHDEESLNGLATKQSKHHTALKWGVQNSVYAWCTEYLRFRQRTAVKLHE